MFANLKNKLLEEVKASPSKFQQFANAAQAAVTSTPGSTTNSEALPQTANFFSITEEDTPQNSPFKASTNETSTGTKPKVSPQAAHYSSTHMLSNGAVPRTRRLSNSSMASDISFRLPSYDSPAVYHLQSDLDVSASEVEDNSSSAHLDLISKEQLHDAYKRALDRYQKYRGRYTDLAKKYKDLERDSTKARSVLVETQDKAIRRISELREQCTLEQQAKAHLEEALRMEMDDMQCKITSYQTKLNLLKKSDNDKEDSLIELSAEENNLINLEGDEKKANLEKLLEERNKNIEELNAKLEEMRKREEENSILMAQNKQAIHSELENKESELKKLQSRISEFEQKLEKSEKQVSEMNDLKSKIKQITAAKQEVDAKLIANEHILGQLKKDLKEKDKTFESVQKSLEEQLANVRVEYEDRVRSLEQQKNDLNDMLARQQESAIALAEVDNESNRVKTENLALRETLLAQRSQLEEMQTVKNDLKAKTEELLVERTKAEKLVSENAASKAENETLCEKVKHLESELESAKTRSDDQMTEISAMNEKLTKSEEVSKELAVIKAEHENLNLKIKQLETEKELLSTQNEKTDSEAVAALKEALQKANDELNEQTRKLQELISAKETEIGKNSTEIAKLQKQVDNGKSNLEKEKKKVATGKENLKKTEAKLAELQKEKSDVEDRMNKENHELKAQITKIVQDISQMEAEMRNVQTSHNDLEKEKQGLEKKIEKMTKLNQSNAEGSQKWQNLVREADEKLKQVESKLQAVQSENSQLAEKNCLHEENSNRLEKLIADNQADAECKAKLVHDLESELDGVRNELLTAKKSKDKMSQVLDENSRLHNAKEIMEHELKSLQDKCEDKEKEKLCLLDSNKCLESELKAVKEESENLVRENTNLGKMSNDMRSDLDTLSAEKLAETEKWQKLQAEFDELVKQQNSAEKEVVQALKKEIEILEAKNKEELHSLKATILTLEEDKTSLSQQNEANKSELDALNNNNQVRLTELENLLKKSRDENQSLQQSVRNATDLEKKLQNYEQLEIENEYLKTLTTQIETEVRSQRDGKAKLELEVAELQNQIETLKSIKDKQQGQLEDKDKEVAEIDSRLKEQLASAQSELAKLKTDSEAKTEEMESLRLELQESKASVLELTKDFKSATKLLQKLEIIEADNEKFQERIKQMEVEHAERLNALKNESTLEAVKNNQQESDNLRKLNERLQRELEDLKYKSSAEISNLSQEMEDMAINLKHATEKALSLEKLREERDRMSAELRELREGTFESPIGSGDGDLVNENLAREKDELEDKLKRIMHEVQDVSNRNLFLEQKCENFLILEQSNERLKLANEKLSRQLDETLISMQHNEGIAANTEFEYLRNIMFQYLTGTVNNNNDTLVKVISAVLKFSPQQTQVAIEKEHQRRSLLGQFNKLL